MEIPNKQRSSAVGPPWKRCQVELLLAFSSPEEVEGETYHLKSQCLESQVNDLKAMFKDIMRFRTPMDISESQLGRAVQFKSELQKILHAAIAAADVIEGRVAQVKGNAGRWEEEMFRVQMEKKEWTDGEGGAGDHRKVWQHQGVWIQTGESSNATKSENTKKWGGGEEAEGSEKVEESERKKTKAQAHSYSNSNSKRAVWAACQSVFDHRHVPFSV